MLAAAHGVRGNAGPAHWTCCFDRCRQRVIVVCIHSEPSDPKINSPRMLLQKRKQEGLGPGGAAVLLNTYSRPPWLAVRLVSVPSKLPMTSWVASGRRPLATSAEHDDSSAGLRCVQT